MGGPPKKEKDVEIEYKHDNYDETPPEVKPAFVKHDIKADVTIE